jgi:hypothetical protein
VSFRFRMRCYLLLLIALLLICVAVTFSAEPEDILKRPDVAQSIKVIKHEAFDGKLYPYETVLEVLPLSTEFYSGTEKLVQLPSSPKDLIAIIYCHSDPKPSDKDIETAKTSHVPVFTISRKATWMTLPDGTSKEIK